MIKNKFVLGLQKRQSVSQMKNKALSTKLDFSLAIHEESLSKTLISNELVLQIHVS